MKEGFRSKSVTTKITEPEYERIVQMAGASNRNISEWMRECLFRELANRGLCVAFHPNRIFNWRRNESTARPAPMHPPARNTRVEGGVHGALQHLGDSSIAFQPTD